MKLKAVAARLTLMRLMRKSEANGGQKPPISSITDLSSHLLWFTFKNNYMEYNKYGTEVSMPTSRGQ